MLDFITLTKNMYLMFYIYNFTGYKIGLIIFIYNVKKVINLDLKKCKKD